MVKYKEHHGLLFAVFASILSGVTASLIRWTEAAPLWTIVFFRFAIGTLILLPFLYYQDKLHITYQSVRRHLTRALFGLTSMTCFFYAIVKLSLINAITLLNTAPLFLPLLLFFYKRKIVPPMRMLALFIGFIGIVIILRPSENIHSAYALVGLFSGFCLACVQVIIRNLSKTEPIEAILMHFFIISTVISFFPMIYFWEPIAYPELWLNFLLISVASLLYQFCFAKSLGIAKVTKVGAVNYLAVPFGGLFGWWFFQEVPSLWILGGTGLIVCGGVIAILSKRVPKT